MQLEFYTLRRENDEALKKVSKYQENLKEADERVKQRDASLLQPQKERKHMQALLNGTRDDLIKA